MVGIGSARAPLRSLGLGALAFGLAALGGASARADAWWLSVNSTTMAWSFALTAGALDMLATAGIERDRGEDPDDPHEYQAISVRAIRLLLQTGLETYPLDGAGEAPRIAVYCFDVTSGQGADDDAGWHDDVSFSPSCHGCVGATDTMLDLLADFTLPPEPEPEN